MGIFAGLLPLTAYVAAWIVGAARFRSWRLGLLSAFVTLGVFALVATELLSLVDAVRQVWVGVTYMGLIAILLALIWKGPRPGRPPWREWLSQVWIWLLIAQFAVLFTLALAAAPNNADSMSYHMARVAHWVSAGTLKSYATEITNQLYLSPLAEIGIADLQILTGQDRLANLIQLLAHVVAVTGVTLLAQHAGLDRKLQGAAGLIAGTAPMAVAQAATTQNDYVVAAFLITAAVFATRPVVPEVTWGLAIPVAIALGLGVATKATALIFGFPLAIWFAWTRMRWRPRTLLPIVGVAAALVLALNAGHLARNISVFGNPLGPPEPALRNEEISLNTVAGNVVRNAGHNLGVPHTEANERTTSVLRATLSSIGIDPDRPSALFGAASFDVDSSRNEDRASSPGQWLLLLAAAAVAIFSSRLRRRVGGLLLVIASGYALFSLVLKWQPWGGRLLLPLLLLGAVPAAALLAQLPRWLRPLTLTALVVASLPWLLISQYRPLVGTASVLTSGPEQEYFAVIPDQRRDFEEATDYVRRLGVTRVGFRSDENDYEYPLWQMLRDGQDPIEVVAVDVTNESAKLEERQPDVVLCLSRCATRGDSRLIVRHFGGVAVEVAK